MENEDVKAVLVLFGVGVLSVAAFGFLSSTDTSDGSYSASSPSKRFRLMVRPTQRGSERIARYEMWKDGKSVWRKTLDAILVPAVVDDLGRVAGFTGRTFSGQGFFHVMLLAPGGRIFMDDMHPLYQSRIGGWTPSLPNGEKLKLDGAHDRLSVWVTEWKDGPVRKWWVYSLSKGKLERVQNSK